jgi:hypothetical protein
VSPQHEGWTAVRLPDSGIKFIENERLEAFLRIHEGAVVEFEIADTELPEEGLPIIKRRKPDLIDRLTSERFFWRFVKVCGALIVLVLAWQLFGWISARMAGSAP